MKHRQLVTAHRVPISERAHRPRAAAYWNVREARGRGRKPESGRGEQLRHGPRVATALVLTGALASAGCQHTIRLDPGSEDAAVYVNGDLRGSGVSKYEVDDEYGFPESFTAKVYPAATGSAPYSVEISREFDWGRGFYSFGTGAVTGLAFLGLQYLQVRDQIAQKPGDWPVLMFPAVWSWGFFGGLTLLSSPFDLLRSFKYREFYDLEQMRDSKGARAARGDQEIRMKTSE